MSRFTTPHNILITGASGGIGAALAESYAAPGIALALMGRNRQRLERTADICRLAGAQVYLGCLDVRDAGGMEKWIVEFDQDHPLDLVIANAAISASLEIPGEPHSRDEIDIILDTNINGVLNTITPVIDPMRKRNGGQIALVSSIAGYYGLPSLPAYCAAKAAVKAYGESLRGLLKKEGIGVSVICPGFVLTSVTARVTGPTPLAITAEQAAKRIKRGLMKNRGRIAFPSLLAFGSALLTLLPPWVADLFIDKFDFRIAPKSDKEN